MSDPFQYDMQRVAHLLTLLANMPRKSVAGRLGISPQYLCDILSDRRDISAKTAIAIEDRMPELMISAENIMAAQAVANVRKERHRRSVAGWERP